MQEYKGIGKIIGGSIESIAGVIIAKAGLGTFIFSNKFNLKDGKAAGVLMMVDGAALTFIGMSDAAEGTGDIINSVTGNPNKKSENFIKDKMFGGDESAYLTSKLLLVALGQSGITTTKMWMGSSLAGGNQTTVKPGSEGTSGAKFVKGAEDVIYNGKSVDKSFGKHGKDFGSYPDGSSSSVKLFEQDVKELINTGVQKSGTWYGKQGTHIYNPSTKQWAFINSDGTFNTAFKLSNEQYKYLIETGVVR